MERDNSQAGLFMLKGKGIRVFQVVREGKKLGVCILNQTVIN